MGVSTAERNKRKRERKKREKEERRKQEEEAKKKTLLQEHDESPPKDVEIEYVAEPILSEEFEVLRKFQELVPVSLTDEESQRKNSAAMKVEDDWEDNEASKGMSKRKLREMLRPSVAELKRKVTRPELVEAHDVTAADPEFLIELKSVPGTVPVPRNWGRKRKYLQGKVSLILWLVFCVLLIFHLFLTRFIK